MTSAAAAEFLRIQLRLAPTPGGEFLKGAPEETMATVNRTAFGTLADAVASGECLHLVFSRKRRGAPGGFSKVSARPVTIQGRAMYQFTYTVGEQVTHENLEQGSAADRAVELFSKSFEHAAFFTPTADYALRLCADGSVRCKKSPPTKSAAGPAEHNRTKSRLIPEGVPCPFLIEIGVMTPQGQVRRGMSHKFRQVNRFLELVDDVVPALPSERELRIVDFGCGKSYLTFALHYLLTEIHRRRVRIVGLDRKTDVIRHCAELAGRLGCAGLQFREGDITGHAETEPVDLAVSLHACDTATDDALAQAIRWKTQVILAVPCCQHELAPQIDDRDLAPLLKHGILRERFAALATDALRALVLEICGYSTQVIEFIDLEHTAKNLLIRGVKRTRVDPELRAARLAEYRALKSSLGLETPRLPGELGLLAETPGDT
jgi:SAM-dependent methyltransferase